MRLGAAILVAAFLGGPTWSWAADLSRGELEAAVARGEADAAMMRKLGDFYASGRDGRRDAKQALRLWRASADAGDPRAPILIADTIYRQIFSTVLPDGSRARTGRVPKAQTEEAAKWYQSAFERDDREDVRSRAQVQAVSLRMMLEPAPR